MRSADLLVPTLLACLIATAARAEDHKLVLPDLPVTTQDGKQLRFYSDLVKGRVVAINFIFTRCTTICPPLGVKFSALQRNLGDRLNKDAYLISVSIDPHNDTPERLKAWSDKFHRKAGWTLVTGRKQDINEILRALNAFNPNPADHTPMVLVGNDAANRWTWTYGLGPAAALARSVNEMIAATAQKTAAPKGAGAHPAQGRARPDGRHLASASARPSEAQKYFTDTELVNQDGKPMRFYSDLIKGRSVVISTVFTRCKGICPTLNLKMAGIQRWLGNRLGKDVVLLSITLDPEYDTPPRMAELARQLKARPGWYFLSGSKENVGTILKKLGQWVETTDDHNAVLLVGNDRTELWKKAQGLAGSGDLRTVIESVVGRP